MKDQLEGQRLRFSSEQRIRLAVKAKILGRRLLDEIETIVISDTLFAWRRKPIAKKWTYARKGPGVDLSCPNNSCGNFTWISYALSCLRRKGEQRASR